MNTPFFKLRVWATALACASTFASCSDSESTDTPDSPFTNVEVKGLLVNEANDVITQTYKDLANKATAFAAAASALEANPSLEKLEATRDAWKAARRPWEQSEGFLFGPVETQNIDPQIDSWPVSFNALNEVLKNPEQLTEKFISSQEGTLKGFHTIEYLLWGQTGEKKFDQFNAAQFKYLRLTTADLTKETTKLYTLWANGYANSFSTAGDQGNKLYVSKKAAIEELVDSMEGIADEVANAKIEDPFVGNNGKGDLTKEESQYSNNSLRDFADNILSMRNIYLGTLNGQDGKGLTVIVQKLDKSLDAELRAAMAKAEKDILDIPVSFSDAVKNNRPAVAKAQKSVRDLLSVITDKLKPLVNTKFKI